MKKNKTVALALGCLAVLLTVVCILYAALPKSRSVATLTEYDKDGGFYSRTSYFYDEAAYGEYCGINSKSAVKKSGNEEFVCAAVKKLYTVGEKENIEEIGSESVGICFLSIEIKVTLEKTTGKFYVNCSAGWANEKSFRGVQTPEHSSMDFLGLSWGGKGAFIAVAQSEEGNYYNSQKLVQIGRCESNSYMGFAWQFYEKASMYGKPLERVTASVTLECENEHESKETDIRLTYIHTYGGISGSPYYVENSHGYAPQLLHPSKENQWSVILTVNGLKY